MDICAYYIVSTVVGLLISSIVEMCYDEYVRMLCIGNHVIKSGALSRSLFEEGSPNVYLPTFFIP